MNETVKTVSFVGAAVLVVGVVWFTRPVLPVAEPDDLRGERLFPDFNDPLAAASLEIVEYDQDMATQRPFQVAKVNGVWSIPSHENYPADAEDQLADAASGVMGLTVLEVASNDAGDHELYGVLDPDPKKRKGTTGVGTRVTMKDKNGRQLMSLIIGNEVPGQSELRYVRKVDQNPVYVTKVDTAKLSSKFEDWIEKDLLKLDTWDIKQVEIRDYTIDELQGTILHRGEMLLEYDDTGDPRWKLTKDVRLEQVGDQAEWVPQEMAEDEELDTSKLDDLKYALDDLKIVDVTRKPAGLSGNLQASKSFYEDREARMSLANRGFYVVPVARDRFELFSNEGEIRVLMKDGVKYLLRFGEIAGGGSSAKQEDESEGSGLNRYIFVMAEFEPDAIPKPELEELPEEDAAADAAPGGDEPAEQPADEPSDQTVPDEDPAAAAPDGTAPEEAVPEETPEETSEDAAAEETPEETSGDTPAGETPEETSGDAAAEENPGEETADQETADEKTDNAQDETEADLQAERERIEEENKKKTKEYEEKIEKGEKRVKELNARFADWYYIISDDVYQKIHLSREQIVKKEEKTEEDDESGDDAGDASAAGDSGQDDAGTAADNGGTAAGDANAAGDDSTAAAPGAGNNESPGPVEEFHKLKQEGADGGQSEAAP